MPLPYQEKLTPRARELRKKATKQENHLWYDYLKDYPIRFKRQKPISSFIADFYCHAARLVVELDGSQHFEDTGVAQDQQRDADLRGMGYTILRYANSDVNRNLRGVCEDILNHLPAGTVVCK